MSADETCWRVQPWGAHRLALASSKGERMVIRLRPQAGAWRWEWDQSWMGKSSRMKGEWHTSRRVALADLLAVLSELGWGDLAHDVRRWG